MRHVSCRIKRHRIEWGICLVLQILFLSACARIVHRKHENVQIGNASWYGPGFHGKTTSSKEVYNMYDMTAAHRTLPFDTYVVVTNLKNGKSVTVRINDRGPFVKERIIDLSYAAAEIIGAVGPGVVPVKLSILEGITAPSKPVRYAVQAGSFVSKDNAAKLRDKLKASFHNVQIQKLRTEHQTFYRVRIKAENRKDAERIALKLANDGVVSYVVEE